MRAPTSEIPLEADEIKPTLDHLASQMAATA
jgi:hypothetical protein